jgi:hypothetical protein
VRDKVFLVLVAHVLHFVGPANFKVRSGLLRSGRPRPDSRVSAAPAQFPESYQATTGPRQEPKYDLHAPDLYIPTMAFTTYIILNAFALGTYGE